MMLVDTAGLRKKAKVMGNNDPVDVQTTLVCMYLCVCVFVYKYICVCMYMGMCVFGTALTVLVCMCCCLHIHVAALIFSYLTYIHTYIHALTVDLL
jgi:hypothetical protein